MTVSKDPMPEPETAAPVSAEPSPAPRPVPGPPTLEVSGRVATITLRRPDRANVLQPEDLAALDDHVQAVDAMPEVLALVLRAEGRFFCSGFDIGAIGNARRVDFGAMVDRVAAARPVTIAAIQGGVYGGATDLALACDFRVGAEGVDMFLPASRLGLVFYRGGLERYVRRLGVDAAKRIFLTCERLDAGEMKRIGFLTDLVPAETLEARVEALAATLGALAPIAVIAMKKHLNAIADGVFDAEDHAADAALAGGSADLREGRLAWKEKRPPRFTGA